MENCVVVTDCYAAHLAGETSEIFSNKSHRNVHELIKL